MSKSSQRQFLVSVHGIPGRFANLTGGEVSVETSKVYDGGEKRGETLTGVPTCSNIIVTRPYDAELHQPIIDDLQRKIGSWVTTVTKQPCDPEYTPVGKPTTYVECLLKRVLPPEYDQKSSTEATWQLEFETPGPA